MFKITGLIFIFLVACSDPGDKPQGLKTEENNDSVRISVVCANYKLNIGDNSKSLNGFLDTFHLNESKSIELDKECMFTEYIYVNKLTAISCFFSKNKLVLFRYSMSKKSLSKDFIDLYLDTIPIIKKGLPVSYVSRGFLNFDTTGDFIKFNIAPVKTILQFKHCGLD